MPDDLKTFQGDPLTRRNSALLHRDGYLLVHCVNTVKIRKQQAAPGSAGNNHAIPLHIQISLAFYFFRFRQDIHVDFQFIQFFRSNEIVLAL